MTKEEIENMVDREIIEIIKNYKSLLQNLYTIDKIYLFGSYARDKAREDSDIDLAIFLNEAISYELELELMKLRRKIDLRIEPHVFSALDLLDKTPFIEEISTNGIEIF